MDQVWRSRISPRPQATEGEDRATAISAEVTGHDGDAAASHERSPKGQSNKRLVQCDIAAKLRDKRRMLKDKNNRLV